MSDVHIQRVTFDTLLFGEPSGKVEATILNFHDSWTLRFGDYGHMYEVKGTTENMEAFVSVLSAMIIEEDEFQTAETGDANTPWEEDSEACPICGAPLPCPKCLNELRCDD